MWNLNLRILILGLVLFSGNSEAVTTRDCPDWRVSSDGTQCIYIVNDTSTAIQIKSWNKYGGDGDRGDDYHINKDLKEAMNNGKTISVSPGAYYALGNIDDVGWNLADSKGKFRAEVIINGRTIKMAYEKANLTTGYVDDFEFRVFEESDWKDNERYEDKTINGKKYRVFATDSGPIGSFKYERVFTIRELDSAGNEKGSLGYQPPNTNLNKYKLNIMNYNTYLLMGPSGGVSGKPAYYERAKSIWKEKHRIFNNVDILVLNELASQDVESPDAEDLSKKDWLCCDADKPFRQKTRLLNGTPLANGLAGPSETGGVVIMSKYQDSLFNEKHYEYTGNECSGGDCMMDKGYLGVRFKKKHSDGSSKDYYIVATHAQADPGIDDEKARKKQFEAMREYGETRPGNTPVIYIGDFNVEEQSPEAFWEAYWSNGDMSNLPSEYDTLTGTLNATYFPNDKHPYSLTYSDDWKTNFWVKKGHQARYDFILHSKDDELPTHNTWRYLPIRSGSKYKYNGLGTDLSDHHAVVAELDYTGSPTVVRGYARGNPAGQVASPQPGFNVGSHNMESTLEDWLDDSEGSAVKVSQIILRKSARNVIENITFAYAKEQLTTFGFPLSNSTVKTLNVSQGDFIKKIKVCFKDELNINVPVLRYVKFTLNSGATASLGNTNGGSCSTLSSVTSSGSYRPIAGVHGQAGMTVLGGVQGVITQLGILYEQY